MVSIAFHGSPAEVDCGQSSALTLSRPLRSDQFGLYRRSTAVEFKLDFNSDTRERFFFVEANEFFGDLCLRNGAEQNVEKINP